MSITIDKRVANIYNPDNQTKEQLIDGFVVRLKTFKRLFEEIKNAPMTAPEQHVLIEGKRGMGKTTMLLRLSIEIENDPELNSWLLPIVFNEEEYSIRRLYKLWERIAVLLEDESEQFVGLFDDMDQLYTQFKTEEDYEYAIFKLLTKQLKEANRKIILFIDNFGDIFSRFKIQEVQRLREVLQTTTDLRIISASSVVLEQFYDQKHPFFEFFKTIRLKGLNQKETEEVLLKLGEIYKSDTIKDIIKNQKGRVEALRRLTGGVIRTVVLLFEIFNDKSSNSAFADLEAILDRVTPLYKHRMDDLATQQQEIVQAIALAWDAVNVKEISQKTRLESKKVSAQLRTLEKNEVVIKKLTTTKNHLYQLNERFFNIWYLMRHGRKGDRRKVVWLVRFLEEWCDEAQISNRAKAHISYLKSGKYDDRFAWYMTEAIALSKVQLVNKLYTESIETIDPFWKKEENLQEYPDEIAEYISLLIAKEQYFCAFDYFNSPESDTLQLKDRFKIHYYALLFFLQDKYPNEYLRMGEELKETVAELIERIKELRKKYS